MLNSKHVDNDYLSSLDGGCFHGTLTAFDKDLSHQTAVINNGDVGVQGVEKFSFFDPVLPIMPSSQLSDKNITYIASRNALVLVNSSNGITYDKINLTCTPTTIIFGPSNTTIHGLCPGKIVVIPLFPLQAPRYFSLRRMESNFNGIILFDSTNTLHFVTGVEKNLYIKNFRSGQDGFIDVPSCNYVSNIKVVSGNFIAVFCADSKGNASLMTSVHFRNLSIEHYTNVKFTEPVNRDSFTVRSLGEIVIITSGHSLHIIDRVSGQYSYKLVSINDAAIADMIIVNPVLAYYITTNLVMFSPKDILSGVQPSSQKHLKACGPPDCAPSVGIENKGILYSVTNTSLKLRDTDCTLTISLSIKTLFYVHNLTSANGNLEPETEPEKPFPTTLVLSILIAFALLSIIVIFVSLVLIRKYRFRDRSSNTSRQESDSNFPIPEYGQGVQETTACDATNYPIQEDEQGVQETTERETPNHPIQENGQGAQETAVHEASRPVQEQSTLHT